MSIFAHKTGLIETTGKTGSGIVTSNLIGNFDPSTGINTDYWDNQVGGGANQRAHAAHHRGERERHQQLGGRESQSPRPFLHQRNECDHNGRVVDEG